MKYQNIKYQVSHDTKILFVGINPSPGSYQRRVPFSSNKSFWYLLHEAGFIPENREELKNDKILKKVFTQKFTKLYKLGLINLVYRPTRTISEIKRQEAVPGILRITKAINYYKPPVVCFIGKRTYELFAKISHGHYGWQESIGSSKVFVMHAPIHSSARTRIKELTEIVRTSGLKRTRE